MDNFNEYTYPGIEILFKDFDGFQNLYFGVKGNFRSSGGRVHYQDFWIGSELNYLLWKPNFTLKENEYNGLPFEEDLDLSALFFLLELNADLILTKSGV